MAAGTVENRRGGWARAAMAVVAAAGLAGGCAGMRHRHDAIDEEIPLIGDGPIAAAGAGAEADPWAGRATESRHATLDSRPFPQPVEPAAPEAAPRRRASNPAPAALATRPLAAPTPPPEVALAPPAIPARPSAAPAPNQVDPVAKVEALIGAGRDKLAGLGNYRVKLDRQERVGDRLFEPESVLLSIRREPFAVRIEWPEGPNQGREALYAADSTAGQLVVKLAAKGLPIPPVRMAPDSPLALKNSRHPITEAGLDPILANLAGSLAQIRAGDPQGGRLDYQGLATPEGVGRPCHVIVRTTPDGETWRLDLDAATYLPARLEATDAAGQLLERYAFSAPETDLPELAAADAFNPEVRFATTGGGLLGRLARGAAGANPPAAPASTTR